MTVTIDASPDLDALLANLDIRAAPQEVRAMVAALPVDDRPAGVPKDPDASPLFQLYARLADPARTETLRLRFLGGISWDDARAAVADLLVRRQSAQAA